MLHVRGTIGSCGKEFIRKNTTNDRKASSSGYYDLVQKLVKSLIPDIILLLVSSINIECVLRYICIRRAPMLSHEFE